MVKTQGIAHIRHLQGKVVQFSEFQVHVCSKVMKGARTMKFVEEQTDKITLPLVHAHGVTTYTSTGCMVRNSPQL